MRYADAVGHGKGPHSPEVADITVRTDLDAAYRDATHELRVALENRSKAPAEGHHVTASVLDAAGAEVFSAKLAVAGALPAGAEVAGAALQHGQSDQDGTALQPGQIATPEGKMNACACLYSQADCPPQAGEGRDIAQIPPWAILTCYR